MHTNTKLESNDNLLLQNANAVTPLLHNGNVLSCVITDIEYPLNICRDGYSRNIVIGSVLIEEDIITDNTGKKLQSGDFVLVYNPSSLDEFIFRVNKIEENSPSGTLIYLIEINHGNFSDLSISDVILIGISLEYLDITKYQTPEPLRTTRIRNTSARLEFSKIHDIQRYRIRYKETDSNTWNIKDILDTNLFTTISDLTTKTTYEWQIMGFYSFPTEFSQYSKSMLFKTT